LENSGEAIALLFRIANFILIFVGTGALIYCYCRAQAGSISRGLMSHILAPFTVLSDREYRQEYRIYVRRLRVWLLIVVIASLLHPWD
jgi:hypothetical protein